MPDAPTSGRSSAHVTAEQVADLLEGLLSSDEAATVAVHLSECAECAQLRERLSAVPALLADVAASTAAPMPAEVAARIDAALAEAAGSSSTASAAAAAGPPAAQVVSLEGRRRARVRRALIGIGAAAATVVGVAVVGSALSPSGPGTGTASRSSAQDTGSQQDLVGGSARSGPAGPPRVSPDTFAAGARRALLQGAPAPDQVRDQVRVSPSAGIRTDTGCSPQQLAAAGVSGRAGPTALLGHDLVTLVTSGPPDRRLVVAYSCAGGSPVEQARAHVDLTR